MDGPSLYAVDSGVEYNQRLYSFIQLRMQVCRELNIPGKEESDLNVELASMHAMCLGKPTFLVCQDLVLQHLTLRTFYGAVGDSPVSVVRWHYQNDTDGRCGIIIDRLVGPQIYHNKGYAYRCLYTAFLTAKQSGAPIDYVVTYVPSVPEYMWAGHKLESMGFQVIADAPQYVWCRTNMYTMRMELRRSVDGSGVVASELDNLLGYLLQKSSMHT